MRLVDIASTRYAIARRYMIRLRKDDFEDPQELARLATTAKLTPEDFRKQFEYLVAEEPPPLFIDQKGERAILGDSCRDRRTHVTKHAKSPMDHDSRCSSVSVFAISCELASLRDREEP